jgi:hypothetical protein
MSIMPKLDFASILSQPKMIIPYFVAVDMLMVHKR